MDHDVGTNKILTTEDVIEALTRANKGGDAQYHQSAFRQALQALVKLAKVEKMLEIKRDTAAAIGIRVDGRDL